MIRVYVLTVKISGAENLERLQGMVQYKCIQVAVTVIIEEGHLCGLTAGQVQSIFPGSFFKVGHPIYQSFINK